MTLWNLKKKQRAKKPIKQIQEKKMGEELKTGEQKTSEMRDGT